MKFPITYNKNTMTLHIRLGKYHKYLQCPFATWWKARKYFKRPKFKFYFGPMWKYKGKKVGEFGEYEDYDYRGGYWPAASTNFLRWYTPKWFPIHILSQDIMWKDKFNSPRYEDRPGCFIIFFGRDYHKHWQFSITVNAPKFYCNNDCTQTDYDDNYWESILWYLYYADEYNPQTKERDITKARDTMRVHHWSKSNIIELNDMEILDIGTDILNMGQGDEREFTFFDIHSEKLNDFTYKAQEWAKDMLMSSVQVYVRIELGEKNKNIFKPSRFIKIHKLITQEGEDDKVRLYYIDEDQRLLKTCIGPFASGKNEFIKFSISEYIDLGPSFKDDFLTGRGRKEICKHKKD